MESFFNYLSTHPAVAFVVAAVILLMVYFVVKKLLKLALVLGLILIALCGYLYFTAPEKFPDNVETTISEVKKHTRNAVEKGKDVVEAGKDMVQKGKDLAKDVAKKVDK